MTDNTVYEFEAYKEFEEIINDLEDEVEILGMKYPAGTALRLLDRTAFRQQMLTYFDDMEIEIV